MLLIEEKAGSQAITYAVKDGSQSYTGTAQVCTSPTCNCLNVYLIFDFCNDQPIAPGLKIVMNLENRSINTDETEPGNLDLTRDLINDLAEPDWQALTRLFFNFKAEYTRQADLNNLDVYFPMVEIERDGQLVSYYDIFPFSELISFTLNDKLLLVEDMYCVLPHCHCHEAHLFFQLYNKDNIFFPYLNPDSPQTHLSYNLKKNRWHLEEKNSLKIAPERLYAALAGARDPASFYRHRYEITRQVYKNFRTQMMASLRLTPKDRIGRNDPCPCGSGKKYKHCCMGKEL